MELILTMKHVIHISFPIRVLHSSKTGVLLLKKHEHTWWFTVSHIDDVNASVKISNRKIFCSLLFYIEHAPNYYWRKNIQSKRWKYKNIFLNNCFCSNIEVYFLCQLLVDKIQRIAIIGCELKAEPQICCWFMLILGKSIHIWIVKIESFWDCFYIHEI